MGCGVSSEGEGGAAYHDDAPVKIGSQNPVRPLRKKGLLTQNPEGLDDYLELCKRQGIDVDASEDIRPEDIVVITSSDSGMDCVRSALSRSTTPIPSGIWEYGEGSSTTDPAAGSYPSRPPFVGSTLIEFDPSSARESSPLSGGNAEGSPKNMASPESFPPPRRTTTSIPVSQSMMMMASNGASSMMPSGNDPHRQQPAGDSCMSLSTSQEGCGKCFVPGGGEGRLDHLLELVDHSRLTPPPAGAGGRSGSRFGASLSPSNTSLSARKSVTFDLRRSCNGT